MWYRRDDLLLIKIARRVRGEAVGINWTTVLAAVDPGVPETWHFPQRIDEGRGPRGGGGVPAKNNGKRHPGSGRLLPIHLVCRAPIPGMILAGRAGTQVDERAFFAPGRKLIQEGPGHGRPGSDKLRGEGIIRRIGQGNGDQIGGTPPQKQDRIARIKRRKTRYLFGMPVRSAHYALPGCESSRKVRELFTGGAAVTAPGHYKNHQQAEPLRVWGKRVFSNHVDKLH